MKAGFFQAKADGPGTWTEIPKGMLLRIPVTLETGETSEALVMFTEDEEKTEKARTTLKSWGWEAQEQWPEKGATVRVNVIEKVRDGKTEFSCWLVNKNAGPKKVEGSALSNFLKEEKAKLTGKSSDPFG